MSRRVDYTGDLVGVLCAPDRGVYFDNGKIVGRCEACNDAFVYVPPDLLYRKCKCGGRIILAGESSFQKVEAE